MSEDSVSFAEACNPTPPPTPYADTVKSFLDKATWLDPILDGPFIVHAEHLASSLDQQLAKTGEVQSALASTYAKVLGTLLRNRPAPAPAPTDPYAPGPSGTASIFEQLG